MIAGAIKSQIELSKYGGLPKHLLPMELAGWNMAAAVR